MTLDMHAHVDPSVDRVVQAHVVGTLALVVLIDNLLAVDLLLLSLFSLAQLRDLAKTPIDFLVVGSIALIGLLLLLNHRCVEPMPGEHLDIGFLVGVQLLLKADLEARFQ